MNDNNNDDEIMLSLPTIERIIKLQKILSYKEGRELGFTETIDYLLEHFIDTNILKIKN